MKEADKVAQQNLSNQAVSVQVNSLYYDTPDILVRQFR